MFDRVQMQRDRPVYWSIASGRSSMRHVNQGPSCWCSQLSMDACDKVAVLLRTCILGVQRTCSVRWTQDARDVRLATSSSRTLLYISSSPVLMTWWLTWKPASLVYKVSCVPVCYWNQCWTEGPRNTHAHSHAHTHTERERESARSAF